MFYWRREHKLYDYTRGGVGIKRRRYKGGGILHDDLVKRFKKRDKV